EDGIRDFHVTGVQTCALPILLAVRRRSDVVTMRDFDLAIERVVAGLQRKTPLRDEVRRKVAYHEAGHALVAHLLPTPDQVHKVKIGRASRRERAASWVAAGSC